MTVQERHYPPRGKRDELSKGQHHQLRNAMALEAHARNGRDVFVTQDTTAFIENGKWEKLEALCRTKIMTVDEFIATVPTLAPPRDGRRLGP